MITTEEVADRITKNEQVVFVKYGDGEINCMTGVQGCNCDGDNYTSYLGSGLVHSLAFYIQHPEYYVGKWHGAEGIARMQHVLNMLGMGEPNWADYHLVMNDNIFFQRKGMYELLQAIQNTKRKKIIFSNERNLRMKELFRADTYIIVPERNWFENFPSYYEKVVAELTTDCLVFTSAGQGSKVLIAQLLTAMPSISCIDFGSSFDFLCQKKKSRDWTHSYEQETEYYKDLLPQGW